MTGRDRNTKMESDKDEVAVFLRQVGDLPKAEPEAIMRALIEFSAYREREAGDRPSVFDDPYVAALLVDENNNLLGLYRKRSSQEVHAEPNAILDALRQIKTTRSKDIFQKIEQAYEAKSWLRSAQEVEAFEKLFEDAAQEIRKERKCSEMRLFSTLEPCKDYEAQPSCSCILCAAGVDEVYYAADDTNPKGQGRIVLETGELPGRTGPITGRPPRLLVPNLLVTEALNANSLFYTVGSIIQRFFDTFDLGQSISSNAYSIFSLKDWALVPSKPDEADRIVHRFERGELPPIYTAALAELGMSATGGSLHDPENEHFKRKKRKVSEGKFDDQTVLVLKHPAESALLDILFERAEHNLTLPRSIISTHPFSSLDQELIASLEEKGAKFYPYSFRKLYERFLAHKHVLLSDLRDEYRDHLSILLKFNVGNESDPNSDSKHTSEPYESCFARRDQVQGWLNDRSSKPSRLTIYVGSSHATSAIEILEDLDRNGAFQDGALSSASVQLRISDPRGVVDENVMAVAKKMVSSAQLGSRVTVLDEQLLEALDAEMVSKLLLKVSVSPTAFSPRFLNSLSKSKDWRDRRNAGQMLAEIVSKEVQLLSGLVTAQVSKAATNGLDSDNWTSLCSYMNAIEDLPRSAVPAPDQTIENALSKVAMSTVTEIKSQRSPSWLIDVIWRWLACWAKHAPSPDSFARPFSDDSFRKFLERDPFLLSQLVYYVVVNTRPEDVGTFLEAIFKLLSPSDGAIKSTGMMLARTAFALEISKKNALNGVLRESCKALGDHTTNIFDDEWLRCTCAWKERLGGIERADSSQEKMQRFATLENLRTVIPAVRRKSLEVSTTEDALGNKQSWRGDQVQGAADTLAELAQDTVEVAIRGLIRDPDVGAKWAGVICALGTKSKALEDAIAPDRTKEQFHKLREVRRSLLLDALGEEAAHYWLIRETIADYRKKNEALTQTFVRSGFLEGDYSLPALSAFPAIRAVFDEEPKNLHPEVRREIDSYLKTAKRIALVLPPIAFEERLDPSLIGSLQNEGSPPLGLGQIATTLSSHGHYVEIIDAHRFKFDRRKLAEKLLSYDIVGFSAVISTLSSITDICTEMANAARGRGRSHTTQPTIVLGGHAPTLVGLKGMPLAIADFIVRGAGEEAMLAIASEALLDIDKYEPKTCAIERVSRAQVIAYKKDANSEAYASLWPTISWTERLIFRDLKTGAPYEPASTRNSDSWELHVVMTRGCNWHCSFCTEALIGGGFGEMRRPVIDVINEIKFALSLHGSLKVQFVDDNVLPPAKKGGRKGRTLSNEQVIWAQDFLSSLCEFRDADHRFSWRGIMRIEDFILYEEEIDGFEKLLADSGCNLLSFGIESGNPNVRNALKGVEIDDLSNDRISELMSRIRKFGIKSKAYFIIGGKDQTIDDIEKTIEYATSGAFDLAYFAIYKDFREITSKKTKDIKKLDFDLYASRLDECLESNNDELWEDVLGDAIDCESRSLFSNNYALLRQLGFSFQKHIKYNDYHETAELYVNMGFDGSKDYLRKLAEAYVRFYCRPSWNETYAELLENGY